MTTEEALRVIEGHCTLLFDHCGEPTAWRQRQAFTTLKAEIECWSAEAEQKVFDALWEVAQDYRLEALTSAGTRYAVTGDVVRQMAKAAVAALASARFNLASCKHQSSNQA